MENLLVVEEQVVSQVKAEEVAKSLEAKVEEVEDLHQ